MVCSRFLYKIAIGFLQGNTSILLRINILIQADNYHNVKKNMTTDIKYIFFIFLTVSYELYMLFRLETKKIKLKINVKIVLRIMTFWFKTLIRKLYLGSGILINII